VRYAFVFDQNRCTGCHACRLACTIESGLALDQSWRSIHTFNQRHDPRAPAFHLSLACNHCATAACMNACPALAYRRDAATGAVLVDEAKCIGCRYCTWACPYDAPRFDAARGVVTKCTFCVERLTEGRQPACAALCPTGALKVEKLPEEEITNAVTGFPASCLGPAVKIVPWREGSGAQPPWPSRMQSAGPAPLRPSAAELMQPPGPVPIQPPPSRITLRSEWSLALFTLLMMLLVALVAARAVADLDVSVVPFLGLALAGMGLSTMHLGKPFRAWRAVLGVASSWLSREVLAFTLFVASGAAYLVAAPGGAVLGWIALGLGAVTLIAVDMVYRVALRPGVTVPHSAGAVLTGLFLAGVLAGTPVVAGIAGVAKLGLYVWRKVGFVQAGMAKRPVLSLLRAACLPAAAAVWAAGVPPTGALVLVPVLLGELIDRGEYYAELEIMTPDLQLARDLARRLEAAATTPDDASRPAAA
jgi:Fe-S-cluster-containing dehydrogenase component/DMSO reductase anchor subunit